MNSIFAAFLGLFSFVSHCLLFSLFDCNPNFSSVRSFYSITAALSAATNHAFLSRFFPLLYFTFYFNFLSYRQLSLSYSIYHFPFLSYLSVPVTPLIYLVLKLFRIFLPPPGNKPTPVHLGIYRAKERKKIRQFGCQSRGKIILGTPTLYIIM